MDLTPPEEGLTAVVLFPNQGGGFGYGVTRQLENPEGYDRTINMRVREGQVFGPAFVSKLGSLELQKTPSFMVAWQDTSGVPVVIYSFFPGQTGGIIIRKNDVLAGEVDATTAEYGTADFHDDGAGVAYLYAGTVSGSKFINRRTQAGTWTEDADVVAMHVVSAGGALWGTTSAYQIRKCPPGSEPFTIGNWGTAIQVGTNEAAILRLGAIGATPVVFKEDGIWVFNEADTRFENRLPVPRNEDNFPFVRSDNAGGLYSSTANGAIVHISQYGSITVIDMLRNKTPGRDTPHGPITDITVSGDRLWAFMGGLYKFVQPSGMKVMKTVDNFSTFTNYTTETTDLKHSTVADISLLDTLANGDALLVGFDDKFLAIHYLMVALNTTGTASYAFSTGAGTWSTVATGDYDGTATHTSAAVRDKSFAQTGAYSLQELGSDLSTWVTATYNAFSKYWVRVVVSAAVDAATTIAEVSILPLRAAPDFPTTYRGNIPVWEATGMLPKVFSGKRYGDSLIWDDVYTLADPATAGRMVVSTMPATGSPSGALVIATEVGAVTIALPLKPEPSTTPYPQLARDWDSVDGTSPVLYPSAVDFGTGLYRLRYMDCYGADFTSETDSWGFSFRWDDTNAWSTPEVRKQANVRFSIPDDNYGSVLHTAFQILDGAATDPIGPTGRGLVAWVEKLERDPFDLNQPTRTAPEVS